LCFPGALLVLIPERISVIANDDTTVGVVVMQARTKLAGNTSLMTYRGHCVVVIIVVVVVVVVVQ